MTKNEEKNYLTKNNEQSPYLAEVVHILSLLSPDNLNKAINYLADLKEKEDNL